MWIEVKRYGWPSVAGADCVEIAGVGFANVLV
jgi:hypothetical protein